MRFGNVDAARPRQRPAPYPGVQNLRNTTSQVSTPNDVGLRANLPAQPNLIPPLQPRINVQPPLFHVPQQFPVAVAPTTFYVPSAEVRTRTAHTHNVEPHIFGQRHGNDVPPRQNEQIDVGINTLVHPSILSQGGVHSLVIDTPFSRQIPTQPSNTDISMLNQGQVASRAEGTGVEVSSRQEEVARADPGVAIPRSLEKSEVVPNHANLARIEVSGIEGDGLHSRDTQVQNAPCTEGASISVPRHQVQEVIPGSQGAGVGFNNNCQGGANDANNQRENNAPTVCCTQDREFSMQHVPAVAAPQMHFQVEQPHRSPFHISPVSSPEWPRLNQSDMAEKRPQPATMNPSLRLKATSGHKMDTSQRQVMILIIVYYVIILY